MSSEINDSIAGEGLIAFSYRTDGEHGEIEARDFDAAKQMLCEMFTEAIIADGGWGWVDDEDGERFYVGRENMG
jgi:hypothetical protein